MSTEPPFYDLFSASDLSRTEAVDTDGKNSISWVLLKSYKTGVTTGCPKKNGISDCQFIDAYKSTF